MTDGLRPERAGEELREILAEEIPRLKDPRVGFVTITRVKVTPDLRRAIVHYTVLGDERERKATAAGLKSARGRLRAVVGDEIRMKHLPDLEFREDEDLAEAQRVEELIREIHEEDGGDASG